MPFDPVSWLAVAQELRAGHGSLEEQSRYRTALNRTYYAPLMFLSQRIDAVQGAGTVPTERTHAPLLLALKKTGARHLLTIKSRLETLKELRERADYDLRDQSFSAAEIDGALERATRLVENIRTVPDGLLRNIKF